MQQYAAIYLIIMGVSQRTKYIKGVLVLCYIKSSAGDFDRVKTEVKHNHQISRTLYERSFEHMSENS